MLDASIDGSLRTALIDVDLLATDFRARGERHHLGVALCNRSYILKGMARYDEALASADEAISALESTSAGVELISSRLARASVLAHLGDLDSARREISIATKSTSSGQLVEVLYESAEVEISYGDEDRAHDLLRTVDDNVELHADVLAQTRLVRALLSLRRGEFSEARRQITGIVPGQPRTSIAFEGRRRIAACFLAIHEGDPAALDQATIAWRLAADQGAALWERVAAVARSVADPHRNPSDEVVEVAQADPAVLSICAEALLQRLPELSDGAVVAIAAEAAARPSRWLVAVRRRLSDPDDARRLATARLLERIGSTDDVSRLREVAHSFKDRRAIGLARSLARRLAPPVFVEDLGRVELHVGDRVIEGTQIRRKVLALLCLLVSRPRFAAAREEVLEGLWPDLDPASALNSLNQTTYFLRRVFEPQYVEETSPGYLVQDGEMIWLDPELVNSRARMCFDLIRGMPPTPEPDAVARLAREYRGRFALDFAYEEWASDYRDSLHAAYLRVVEQAIRLDIDAGHFARGTALAERAAELEPNSEEIQKALVQLYRLTGAHAAAAEQYAHYAQALRDLGVEPPGFAEV
jgi:DNA-binding SARP family transcriptional activator